MRSSSRCASLARGRHIEHGLGQHALRQIVEPLEARLALGGGDAPAPEQKFQRVLGLAPPPPAAFAALAVEVRTAHRPVLFDIREHLFDEVGAFAAESGQRAVYALAVRSLLHAPAHQRIGFDRQQRGFMRPVFKQQALAPDGCAVEQRLRVRAESREQRHIMRPHDDADGIDLEEAETGQHFLQMAAVDGSGGFRVRETLRLENDAARRLQRDFFRLFHDRSTRGGCGIAAWTACGCRKLAQQENTGPEHVPAKTKKRRTGRRFCLAGAIVA